MVGYAVAKMEVRGKKLLVVLVMITLMTPRTVTFVPLFVPVSKLGPVSTYTTSSCLRGDTYRRVLDGQFMLGIPDVIMEAARTDGAGVRILLRKVGPAATERVRLP